MRGNQLPVTVSVPFLEVIDESTLTTPFSRCARTRRSCSALATQTSGKRKQPRRLKRPKAFCQRARTRSLPESRCQFEKHFTRLNYGRRVSKTARIYTRSWFHQAPKLGYQFVLSPHKKFQRCDRLQSWNRLTASTVRLCMMSSWFRSD